MNTGIFETGRVYFKDKTLNRVWKKGLLEKGSSSEKSMF